MAFQPGMRRAARASSPLLFPSLCLSLSPSLFPLSQTGLAVLMAAGLAAGSALPRAALAQAGAAAASAAQRPFQVPAGPLAAALTAFAADAGISISAPPALVQGRSTRGVQGRYTVPEALDRLLAGSDLQAQAAGQGSYVLRALPEARGAEAGAASGSGATLGEVRVTAAAERSSTTEGTGSYRAREVSLAKGQALKDVPHSVSVVTRQQIEDQNLISLTDVLDKTTGITVAQRGASSSSYANDSNFYSRGFAVSNMQMDGGAATAAAFGGWAGSVSQLDMAQFDHVEFLRGVDGLFSSTGDPGGTINLVRKRAQPEFAATASASVGRWDNYRVEADITGPVAQQGRVRARLGAALEDRRYFYDTAKDRREVVYGALETDLAPGTVLTVGGSYQRNKGVPFSGGLPRYSNGADLQLPRSTALTADWNTVLDQARLLYARLDHRINDDWSLALNADRLQVDRDAMGLFSSGGADPVSGLGGYWFAFPAQTGSTRTTLNANVKGAFGWLGRRHEVVAGVDLEKGTAFSFQGNTDINGTEFDALRPTVPANPGRNPENNWWDYEQKRHAIYGSLKFALSDPLRLIVGGRHSSYRFDSLGRFASGTDAQQIRFKESGVFTPYAGLTYALNGRWTAYASYAQTYMPQYQQLAGPLPGSALDPVKSRSYEAGIKGELVPARLNAAFALYRINRTGEAMLDPTYPQSWGAYNCCYINRGKVLSQGFDAEISGEPLRGLQLIAGYTFNSNKSKDEASNGRYNSVTPRHLLKVWATYRLPDEARKWKIGGGVQAQSAHYVSGTATTYNPQSGQWDGESQAFRFSQGGYAIWGARIDYEVAPRWNLALNITNLLDKRYYQTMGTSRNGNFYGEPRSLMLSLRGKF